jgi:hypothetical protein
MLAQETEWKSPLVNLERRPCRANFHVAQPLCGLDKLQRTAADVKQP